MKPLKMIWIITLGLLPLTSEAQQKHKAKTARPAAKTETPTPPPPVWTLSQGYGGEQPVYFQDYYTFYDPSRGYTYWSNGGWKSSSVPPAFLSNVDLGKARIQVLKGLTLDMHPEQNYPNYMKLYPARSNDAGVPVPGITK